MRNPFPWLASNDLLARGRVASEAGDVAIRVLHIEVLRSPWGSRERLDDRCSVGDAPLVEGFDAIDARCSVEVLVGAPVLALRFVLGRFLQVKFQSIQLSDNVETIPRLTEPEADLLIVRD